MLLSILLKKIKLLSNPIDYWKSQGAQIGKNCEIYSSANLGSEPFLIKIGNNVRVSSGVKLITHDGGVWVLRNMEEKWKDVDLFGRIVIGDNVHIGTDAIIMPGVCIGSNSIIGCGAIVTRNIPDNSVAIGIPAKVIENIDTYIDKHKESFDYTKNMDIKEKKQYLNAKYK